MSGFCAASGAARAHARASAVAIGRVMRRSSGEEGTGDPRRYSTARGPSRRWGERAPIEARPRSTPLANDLRLTAGRTRSDMRAGLLDSPTTRQQPEAFDIAIPNSVLDDLG